MHVFLGMTLYPFYRGIILSWYLWSSQNTAILKKIKDIVLIYPYPISKFKKQFRNYIKAIYGCPSLSHRITQEPIEHHIKKKTS